MAQIHPTAIVSPSATIGEGTEIGPYCIIGDNVSVGDNCWLQHHVTILGPSKIGDGNQFYSYACIGQRSQDLKYLAEPTYLEIGNRNTFREFSTVHRATAAGQMTKVGSDGNFLSYSHIAHDCIVGNHVIFSNNGTVAGHVEVGDYANIGGLTAIHQFCRIGAHAITGGCSKIVQDVPPFFIADGNPAEIRGVNSVGLERRGYTPEQLKTLKESYRILYRSNLNVKQAVAEMDKKLGHTVEGRLLIDFVTTSQRGIIR
ncbi:MAG TPA: acyl-ACP--UDP-N-acetylglucosamine O-acyltransferase [Chthoniobacterales bacterium]|jgi:UDP-N-acetylglucosamine acyltransferase